jgi:hypothetical protein
MFVFVPSKELTGWINGAGFIMLIVGVARLAYLVGIRATKSKTN